MPFTSIASSNRYRLLGAFILGGAILSYIQQLDMLSKETWISFSLTVLLLAIFDLALFPSLALYTLTPLLLVVLAFVYVGVGWEESQPNEWMIIIENGVMIKAGIGLKTRVSSSQTVVRFPSVMNTINFWANNITKEMQGIQISGFAIWTVYRQDDGPFKCYKYIQGGDSADNIRTLCESIVRDQIANSSLNQVLFQRTTVRDRMRKELQKQLTGWGIWLETIDIQNVTISSGSYFKDLQTDFRSNLHRKAQMIRREAQDKISLFKSQNSVKENVLDNDLKTKSDQLQKEQQAIRQQKTAESDMKKANIEIERLKLNQEFELATQKVNNTINEIDLKNRKKIEAVQNEMKNSNKVRLFQEENKVSENNLTRIRLDVTQKIYKRLPVNALEIVAYSDKEIQNPSSLLPGLAQAFRK